MKHDVFFVHPGDFSLCYSTLPHKRILLRSPVSLCSDNKGSFYLTQEVIAREINYEPVFLPIEGAPSTPSQAKLVIDLPYD